MINVAACIGISPDQRGMPRPQGAQCDIGAVEIGLIIASNESFTVPAAGGMTASVVVNDSAFEQPVALGSNASLTPGTAPAPVVGSITMAADGTISVAPSTTPGSYSYAYTLCVVPATNPASCGTASATVTVQAAAGVAPIPTLGQWGLLPGLLLGGTALRRRT